jgi:tether containing UBX domain for GLUT4
VHFPNRTVLQGFFGHHETIGALHSWVKSCLLDPDCKFELYTTPPKQVLSSFDKTLAQCGLSPASIVYCGPLGPYHGLKLRDKHAEENRQMLTSLMQILP